MAAKRGKRTGRTAYDVISVGSAAVDCFITIPVQLNRLKSGSKVLIDDIHLKTGGGGTNVAVGLSRFGLRTGFIGEVGDDLSADMIQHELKKEGVDFLVKGHSRHMTAYSVILEPKGKDRAILVHKGASSFLHPEEISKSRLNTGWFYFASVVGTSYKTMTTIARYAKKKGISVFFNPSGYMIRKGGKELKTILSSTTILSVNKEEAQDMLKIKSGDIASLLRRLHRIGPEIVIITDGKNGAYSFDGEKVYSKRPKQTVPVDTTGAGDAFGTGFLAGYILGHKMSRSKRMEYAMSLGVVDAHSVCMHVGAKTGLLTRRKALAMIKR